MLSAHTQVKNNSQVVLLGAAGFRATLALDPGKRGLWSLCPIFLRGPTLSTVPFFIGQETPKWRGYVYPESTDSLTSRPCSEMSDPRTFCLDSSELLSYFQGLCGLFPGLASQEELDNHLCTLSWMVGWVGVKRLLFVGRYEQSLNLEIRVSMYKHARPLSLWDGARGGEKRGVAAHASWPVTFWHRIPSHPWILNSNLAIRFIMQVTHHQRMQHTWFNSLLAWFITSKYLETW